MRTSRIDWYTVLLLALGGLGAVLVMLRGSTFGVGLSSDSALYVAAARNLMSGNGLSTLYGTVYADAPPLFPSALASFGVVFGMDPADAAGYLNAAAFGLTIFAAVIWLRSRVRSRFLLIWTGCVCALSLPLANLSAMALTEPLFILFITLSLFALDRFLCTARRWWLFTSAVCAAAAFSTRYAGLPLVAGALLMLLWQGNVRFSERAKNAAIHCIIAVAPIGVWMVRNLLVHGKPTGDWYPSGFAPMTSLGNTVDEFTRWVFGEIGFGYWSGLVWNLSDTIGGRISVDPSTIGTALKGIVLIGLAAGLGYALGRTRSPRRIGGIAVPAVFVSAYAVFCAIVFPLTDIQIYSRFLAPMYVPMLVAVALILNEFFCRAKDRARERTAEEAAASCTGDSRFAGAAARGASWLALAACLSLWLLAQALANYRDVDRWMSDGGGNYSKRAWAESDVIRYLNSNPIGEGARILSNDPGAVYLLTDYPNRWERLDGLPVRLSYAWRWWYSSLHMDSTYVVLFHDNPFDQYEYGTAEFGELPGIELVAVRKDGLILKGNSADFVRESSELIAGAEPVIDSGYQVYHVGHALVYVKKPAEVEYGVSRIGNVLTYSKGPGCRNAAEPVSRFFLHVYPVDENDLMPGRERSGFNNFDFLFQTRARVQDDGRCVALIDLPEYDIKWIITGQSERRGSRYHRFWTRYVFGNDQASRTGYAVPGCSSKGRFLHVYPVHGRDLHPGRDRFGFNKWHLDFQKPSFHVDGWCMHLVPLPRFDVRLIRTGQLEPGRVVWAGEFYPARG